MHPAAAAVTVAARKPQGIVALSQHLRSSANKWWKGSKLRLLEVTKDGAGFPAARWAERYLAMMFGDTGMQTFGPGFEMPNLLRGRTGS